MNTDYNSVITAIETELQALLERVQSEHGVVVQSISIRQAVSLGRAPVPVANALANYSVTGVVYANDSIRRVTFGDTDNA